jgi:hypothetical protein
MTRRYLISSASYEATSATSTQTGHAYRAASARDDERQYARIEPSLTTVLAQRGATRISDEEFDELFGDLPRDGEG